MNRACKDCEFWVVRERQVGQCRFNPPAQVYDVRNSIVANWPDSAADDWCGQFSARPATQTLASIEEDF